MLPDMLLHIAVRLLCRDKFLLSSATGLARLRGGSCARSRGSGRLPPRGARTGATARRPRPAPDWLPHLFARPRPRLPKRPPLPRPLLLKKRLRNFCCPGGAGGRRRHGAENLRQVRRDGEGQRGAGGEGRHRRAVREIRAGACAARAWRVRLPPASDVTDLLGGFEQVDAERLRRRAAARCRSARPSPSRGRGAATSASGGSTRPPALGASPSRFLPCLLQAAAARALAQEVSARAQAADESMRGSLDESANIHSIRGELDAMSNPSDIIQISGYPSRS